MADIVKITTQHLRNIKGDMKTNTIFQGMTRTDGAYGKNLNFYITGYSRFYWLTAPEMLVNNSTSPTLKELWQLFRNITEKGSSEVTGVDDITLETTDVEGGITGNAITAPTSSKENFNSFTIKCPELMGSPVYKLINYWVTGIRDKHTGIADLLGYFDSEAGKEAVYDNTLYTATAIMIHTDPSDRVRGLEKTQYFVNIFPTKIPRAHYNGTFKDHNTVELDLQFAANMFEGPSIDKAGAEIMALDMRMKSYLLDMEFDKDLNNNINIERFTV